MKNRKMEKLKHRKFDNRYVSLRRWIGGLSYLSKTSWAEGPANYHLRHHDHHKCHHYCDCSGHCKCRSPHHGYRQHHYNHHHTVGMFSEMRLRSTYGVWGKLNIVIMGNHDFVIPRCECYGFPPLQQGLVFRCDPNEWYCQKIRHVEQNSRMFSYYLQ